MTLSDNESATNLLGAEPGVNRWPGRDAKLGGPVHGRHGRPPSAIGAVAPSPAARELYASGLQAWRERTPHSLNRALDAFNAALRIDPDHAKALAGLAHTFLLLREYTLMPDAQAYPLAAAAARQALAVDETLPEAHAALAFVEYWGNWDADAAERNFQLAISLGRDWATGHHWYATFLAARGRFREALDEIDRALEIDPSSPALQADRGLLLFHAGSSEAAVAELERVAALNPNFGSPHRYLSHLYVIAGRDEDYLREARLSATHLNDHAQLSALNAAAAALASGGRTAMLSALVADRTDRARSGAASAYSVAWLCALAGDLDGALAWLEKSIVKREAEFVGVVFEPVFHSVLADMPAFEALVAEVAPVVPRRFRSTRGLGGELAAVLDRSSHGLILLSPGGRLRFANLAAEQMLREEGGLRAAAGRLSAARPEDTRRLQAMIDNAALADDENAWGCIALWTPSRRWPLSLTIAPVRSDRSPASATGRSVLVCVTDVDAGVALPVQQLRELFELTPAETRLASALFEGLTPAEAAARFGLSRNTVQAQLASIFGKTGVSRQSGLMRLMMRVVGVGLT